MSEGQYHLDAIPDGLQIFEERVEVMGIKYRRDDARAFAGGRGLALELERELDNPHDKNAIRVIGRRKTLFGSKRHFIGYMPSGLAARIVEGNYYKFVAPRLLKAYIGDSGYVEVLFQILGPKGQRLKYKRADPDSLPLAALGKEAHYTAYVDQVELSKTGKAIRRRNRTTVEARGGNREGGHAKKLRCRALVLRTIGDHSPKDKAS